MAAIIDPRFHRQPRVIRLTRNLAYMLLAAIMAFVGMACSIVAVAAGAQTAEAIAMSFLLGAFGALGMLLIWYILQLRRT